MDLSLDKNKQKVDTRQHFPVVKTVPSGLSRMAVPRCS